MEVVRSAIAGGGREAGAERVASKDDVVKYIISVVDVFERPDKKKKKNSWIEALHLYAGSGEALYNIRKAVYGISRLTDDSEDIILLRKKIVTAFWGAQRYGRLIRYLDNSTHSMDDLDFPSTSMEGANESLKKGIEELYLESGLTKEEFINAARSCISGLYEPDGGDQAKERRSEGREFSVEEREYINKYCREYGLDSVPDEEMDELLSVTQDMLDAIMEGE